MSSKRIIWFLAAVGLVVAFLLWRADEPVTMPGNRPMSARPAATTALPPVAIPSAPPPPAASTARAVATPAPIEPPRPLAPGVVPIRNQKTIDFSSGKPVVQDDAANKAAIDDALKAMEEATKGVSFGPNGGPVMVK